MRPNWLWVMPVLAAGILLDAAPSAGQGPGGDRDRGRGGPPGGFGGGPPGGFGGPGGMNPDQLAEMLMKRYDKDGDGRISVEEAASSDRLRSTFAEHDLNRDGFLDMTEYKAYMAKRTAERNGGQPPGTPPGSPPPPANPAAPAPPVVYGSGGPPPAWTPPARDDRRDERRKDDEKEQPKAPVYRFGKLPKEAPAWFTELDADRDGQIGLYEWRKAGKDMAEFALMDLNNDGFVTAEEWLRYTKADLDRKKTAELVAAVSEVGPEPGSSSESSKRGGPGSRGPWGGSSSGGRGPWGGGPSASAASEKKDDGDKKSDKKDEKAERKDDKRRGPPGLFGKGR